MKLQPVKLQYVCVTYRRGKTKLFTKKQNLPRSGLTELLTMHLMHLPHPKPKPNSFFNYIVVKLKKRRRSDCLKQLVPGNHGIFFFNHVGLVFDIRQRVEPHKPYLSRSSNIHHSATSGYLGHPQCSENPRHKVISASLDMFLYSCYSEARISFPFHQSQTKSVPTARSVWSVSFSL